MRKSEFTCPSRKLTSLEKYSLYSMLKLKAVTWCSLDTFTYRKLGYVRVRIAVADISQISALIEIKDSMKDNAYCF